jgi:predicted DNA-binding transcriptional regulator AlpA
MPQLLLTVPEAVEALAISRSKLYQLITQRCHCLDPHRWATTHSSRRRPGGIDLQAS